MTVPVRRFIEREIGKALARIFTPVPVQPTLSPLLRAQPPELPRLVDAS